MYACMYVCIYIYIIYFSCFDVPSFEFPGTGWLKLQTQGDLVWRVSNLKNNSSVIFSWLFQSRGHAGWMLGAFRYLKWSGGVLWKLGSYALGPAIRWRPRSVRFAMEDGLNPNLPESSISPILSMEYWPTFARTKSPSHGKTTSSMEHQNGIFNGRLYVISIYIYIYHTSSYTRKSSMLKVFSLTKNIHNGMPPMTSWTPPYIHPNINSGNLRDPRCSDVPGPHAVFGRSAGAIQCLSCGMFLVVVKQELLLFCVVKTIIHHPIWKLFLIPIYGDLGDGLLLFKPDYNCLLVNYDRQQ